MPTTRCKFVVRKIDQNASSSSNPAYSSPLAEAKDNITREEVRAKLDAEGIRASLPTIQPTVILAPVYAPNDPQSENGQFWEATPNGEIKLSINNPAGAEVFEIGQEYYVDFTPAD